MMYMVKLAICFAASLWIYHIAESSPSSAIGLLASLFFFNMLNMDEKLNEVRKALGMHTKRIFPKLWD